MLELQELARDTVDISGIGLYTFFLLKIISTFIKIFTNNFIFFKNIRIGVASVIY